MRASRFASVLIAVLLAAAGLVLPSTRADAAPLPPEITTTSLPSVIQGTKYPTTTLKVKGGSWPYKWSVVAGSLPYGLKLTSGGQLSGATSWPFVAPIPITIQVTDRKGLTAVRDFEIVVRPYEITTPSLKDGKKGSYYYVQLKTDGKCIGFSKMVWSLQNTYDPLPAGLKLSPTGAISGVPKVAGTANIRVIAACSGDIWGGRHKEFTLTVN